MSTTPISPVISAPTHITPPDHITPPRPNAVRPEPRSPALLALRALSLRAPTKASSSLTLSSDSSQSPFVRPGLPGSSGALSDLCLPPSAPAVASVFGACIGSALLAPYAPETVDSRGFQLGLDQERESPSVSPFDLLDSSAEVFPRNNRAMTNETARLPSAMMDRSGSGSSSILSARAASRMIPMHTQPKAPFADMPSVFGEGSMQVEPAAEADQAREAARGVSAPARPLQFVDASLRLALSGVLSDFEAMQQQRREALDPALAADLRTIAAKEMARKTLDETSRVPGVESVRVPSAPIHDSLRRAVSGVFRDFEARQDARNEALDPDLAADLCRIAAEEMARKTLEEQVHAADDRLIELYENFVIDSLRKRGVLDKLFPGVSDFTDVKMDSTVLLLCEMDRSTKLAYNRRAHRRVIEMIDQSDKIPGGLLNGSW